LRGSEGAWQSVIGLAGNDDEVICAGIGPDEMQVMLFTKKGKAIRFGSGPVNAQPTPSARGVRAIKLRVGDSLAAGIIFDPEQTTHIIISGEAGYLKRTPLSEFPLGVNRKRW